MQQPERDSQDDTASVDAVYTWVDGADEGFICALHEARAAAGLAPMSRAALAERYADHGELRYSLRSLERFAPWIRRVFIVTNGQRPAWLNAACPRVRVVSHAEIFAEPRDLPVFSSRPIEWNLHRIPGLSRHFLYINDDMYFGRTVERSFFYTPERGLVLHASAHYAFDPGEEQPRLVSDTPRPPPPPAPGKLKMLRHTHAVLDRMFGPRRRGFYFLGIPYFMDRDVISQLVARCEHEVRETMTHKFRNDSDFHLYHAYASYLVDSRAAPHEVRPYVETPRFGATNGVDLIPEMLEFLRGFFPEPSEFEAAAADFVGEFEGG